MAAPETTRLAHFILENVPETVTAYVNEKAAVMIGYIGPSRSSLCCCKRDRWLRPLVVVPP